LQLEFQHSNLSFVSFIFGLQLRLVSFIFGFERGVSDPDLRPQICNLQQLLPQRPLPLHALQRKRLRLRIRPHLLHLQLQLRPRPRPLLPHIAPTALPAPPRSSCRRLLLLRVATARLQLHDGPHALVDMAAVMLQLLELRAVKTREAEGLRPSRAAAARPR
jgi:hypothetical protein